MMFLATQLSCRPLTILRIKTPKLLSMMNVPFNIQRNFGVLTTAKIALCILIKIVYIHTASSGGLLNRLAKNFVQRKARMLFCTPPCHTRQNGILPMLQDVEGAYHSLCGPLLFEINCWNNDTRLKNHPVTLSTYFGRMQLFCKVRYIVR